MLRCVEPETNNSTRTSFMGNGKRQGGTGITAHQAGRDTSLGPICIFQANGNLLDSVCGQHSAGSPDRYVAFRISIRKLKNSLRGQKYETHNLLICYISYSITTPF